MFVEDLLQLLVIGAHCSVAEQPITKLCVDFHSGFLELSRALQAHQVHILAPFK
jgi:hypothetical protein